MRIVASVIARAGALLALLLVVVGGGGLACEPRPDTDACRAMLDRYVEMTARGDPGLAGISGAALDDRLREILAAKREEAVYARAVERCRDETSGGAHACAMKAPSPNEWEACVQ